jgi:hypothetical protein
MLVYLVAVVGVEDCVVLYVIVGIEYALYSVYSSLVCAAVSVGVLGQANGMVGSALLRTYKSYDVIHRLCVLGHLYKVSLNHFRRRSCLMLWSVGASPGAQWNTVFNSQRVYAHTPMRLRTLYSYLCSIKCEVISHIQM